MNQNECGLWMNCLERSALWKPLRWMMRGWRKLIDALRNWILARCRRFPGAKFDVRPGNGRLEMADMAFHPEAAAEFEEALCWYA